jgi:iron(III) transport system permease protein
MRRMRSPLAAAYLTTLAALALAPIASLIVIASRQAGDWEHLAAYVLPPALANTAILLAGVGIITFVAGTGTAWLVTTFEFPARRIFVWLMPLPLAIPTYIVAYVYSDLFEALGPVATLFKSLGLRTPNIRSLGGAVLVMSFVLYPYVYLASRAMFVTQSAAMIEMARVSGASRWQLTRDIALPLARPAIATGVTLALLETLNDVGASEYLGVQTLTIAIFTTWLSRGNLANAAQMANALLLVVVVLFAVEQYSRKRRSFVGIDQGARHAVRLRLPGLKGALAFTACLLPVLAGFLVPAIVLLREVFTRGLLAGFDPALLNHSATTLRYAAIAAAVAVAAGFAAATAIRTAKNRFLDSCAGAASIGYALPGTVLALGLLMPLVALDEVLNWATSVTAGKAVGLVIAGSGGAVIAAYVLRFLAIAIGFGQAGLARIATDLDEAARIAGARPWQVTRTIQWPLLRPAIAGAALLIFVDCLKELPATLLLRPLNVETLSTYIYQYASRGNFEEGALAALLIVAAGILPAIWLARFGSGIKTARRG